MEIILGIIQAYTTCLGAAQVTGDACKGLEKKCRGKKGVQDLDFRRVSRYDMRGSGCRLRL